MSNTVFPKTVKRYTVINDRLFPEDSLFPAPMCYEGENGTLEVHITLDDTWKMLGCHVECAHSDGDLDIAGVTEDGILKYTVPKALMKKGILRFHLRGFLDRNIRKTDDCELIINASFDADGAQPEFEPSAYDNIMANFAFLNQKTAELTENIETLSADMTEQMSKCEQMAADRDIICSAIIKSAPVKNLEKAFEGSQITELPPLDLSKVESMAYAFRNCASLLTVPDLDLSSCTTLYECFHHCYALKSVGRLKTPNVRKMYALFRNCNELESIEEIDLSSADSANLLFANCRNLRHVIFAGSINLSIDVRNTNLDEESIASLVNALSSEGAGKSILLGSHSSKLTEEQLNTINQKGWIIE